MTKPKLKWLVILFCIICIIVLIINYIMPKFIISENQRDEIHLEQTFSERRVALDSFVTKFFMNQGLVQTNIKSKPQSTLASGEDLLSESVGLMLLYYVKTDQQEAFKAHLELADALLLKENGLYQWRYRDGQPVATSATVDDLRMIKALLMASKKWQEDSYEKKAVDISKALLATSTEKEMLLAYDAKDASTAPVFYYDLKTLAYLKNYDSRWRRIYDYGRKQITDQKIDQFPFYRDSLAENEHYKMIENLLVSLYLSEIGELNTEDLAWYKSQIKDTGIFSTYAETGVSSSKIESPAIYGILAQIALNVDDRELYNLACQKLMAMQHMEKDIYYGGFIDVKTKDGFSFDQLMALLAY